MNFKLPILPYAYDALEPYIDAKTMEIHHSKHHQAYLDNFNKALEPLENLADMSPEEILINLNTVKIPEKDKIILKNHGGGFVNHSIFWSGMGPEKQIDNVLKLDIEKTFGGVEEFKNQFSEIAKSHFGSGWAWLIRDENNNLKTYSLPNQDSPYALGHKPIFCIDVWEHAYYLNYQNRRADYVDAWWNLLKVL